MLQSVECWLGQTPPPVQFSVAFPRLVFIAPIRIFTSLCRWSLLKDQRLTGYTLPIAQVSA